MTQINRSLKGQLLVDVLGWAASEPRRYYDLDIVEKTIEEVVKRYPDGAFDYDYRLQAILHRLDPWMYDAPSSIPSPTE